MNIEKKKIRGWKRRKKNVAFWKESYINLDKDSIKNYSRDYVKLWLSPFYSLNSYKLPNWYKKLLVDSLIDIYFSWQRDTEITQQYYLKIWVFEKNFISSQVVIAKDEYYYFYDNTFGDTIIEEALPIELRTSNSLNFYWEKGYIVNIYKETELKEMLEEKVMSNKEISLIKNSAYLVENDDKDSTYYIRDERVWIGEHLKIMK